jgi:hypothetical protein
VGITTPRLSGEGFSVFMKVTELISYLKVKIAEPIPESDLKRLLYAGFTFDEIWKFL